MRSSVDPSDLGNFIREQRRIARLSVRKLSELAGVSNPYLSQIERGLRKPSAEILQALAKGLRISSETLYIRAGFLEKKDVPESDLSSAILADHNLTDEQKHTLLTIYRTFRDANSANNANNSNNSNDANNANNAGSVAGIGTESSDGHGGFDSPNNEYLG